MNGGAACNNSTPRPHLGHFPSAVWQGTTTERTAVLRCGGISGSCAVDISPPLFAAASPSSFFLFLSLSLYVLNRFSLPLPRCKATHTYTYILCPSLILSSSRRYIHASPDSHPYPREPESRESEELWYIGRTHCTGWNAICPPRKAITIRSRENCPISNDTNGRISGNLYLVASLSPSHPPTLPPSLAVRPPSFPSANRSASRRDRSWSWRLLDVPCRTVINVRPTCRGGSGQVWRGHGVEMRGRLARSLARSRCASLYTIGYEVAVTCSWPTDDVTHLGYTASINYTGILRTSVSPFSRSSILGPRDGDVINYNTFFYPED